jgi:hypothetical protein
MMDEPHHAPQRKTVSPMFTPTHLDELAILIRERSAEVLDNLPPRLRRTDDPDARHLV